MHGSRFREGIEVLVCVCSFPGATITEYPGLDSLSNRNLSSHNSGSWKSEIKVWTGSLLLRPVSLTRRWLSSPHVLIWPSLCVCLCPGLLFL